MLCLGRKTNESVIIGDNILVTVLSIRGNHVCLGFEAPASISVHREEVYRRLLAEKEGRVETFLKQPWMGF